MIKRWLRKAIGNATLIKEVVDKLTVPAMRSLLDKEIKTFIDWKEPDTW